MTVLIASAHSTPKPLVLSIIPKPMPRTRYPVITGTVSIKAFFISFLSIFQSSLISLKYNVIVFLHWQVSLAQVSDTLRQDIL